VGRGEPTRGQRALADYIREAGRRPAAGAGEPPDDPRRRRGADGLRALAAYVLRLPPDDQRVLELVTLGYRVGVFAPFEQAADALARFRRDDPREDCGAFLTRLVRLMRDGALRHARDHGVLGDA
jgi:hypothetical protein